MKGTIRITHQTNRKAVLSSAFYIEGQSLSDEEVAQNKAEFEAWTDAFMKHYEKVKNDAGNK